MVPVLQCTAKRCTSEITILDSGTVKLTLQLTDTFLCTILAREALTYPSAGEVTVTPISHSTSPANNPDCQYIGSPNPTTSKFSVDTYGTITLVAGPTSRQLHTQMTPQSCAPSSSSGRLPVGAEVGIAIGAFVFLLLVSVGGVFIYRRRQAIAMNNTLLVEARGRPDKDSLQLAEVGDNAGL